MLEVKEIHSYYGTSHILFGISFECKEGKRSVFWVRQRRKDHDLQEHHRSSSAQSQEHPVSGKPKSSANPLYYCG
jgi:hypothetical protein